MSLSFSPTLLVFAALAAAIGALATLRHQRAARRNAGSPLPAELAALQRRQQLLQWGGIAVGTALAGLLASSGGELGRIQALAPAALGLGLVLGAVAGRVDSTTAGRCAAHRRPQPAGSKLLASSRQRGGLRRALCSDRLILGACALVASPDDLGRAGRAFAETCQAAGITSTRSPFPGSYYARPWAARCFWWGRRRPSGCGAFMRAASLGPARREWDVALRRWSARRILRAANTAVLMSLGPVLAVIAGVLASGGQCAASWQAPVAAVAGVASAVCLVAGTVTLGLLLGATLAASARDCAGCA